MARCLVRRQRRGGEELQRKTPQCQSWLRSGLAQKMRFKSSCARALAASSRLLGEGNCVRNFPRSLRAQSYSVERIVIPIRRNSTPCKSGRNSPATPRAIKTHPARMASQRLNVLVKRSTVHPEFPLVRRLYRKLNSHWKASTLVCALRHSGGLSGTPIPDLRRGSASHDACLALPAKQLYSRPRIAPPIPPSTSPYPVPTSTSRKWCEF